MSLPRSSQAARSPSSARLRAHLGARPAPSPARTARGPGSREAQARTPRKVSAEVLFDEGRRLMSDGKAADACPKFAESQRLDPSPGTLLNLASCYEKTGRPATAWATYREGASSAAATGRQDLVATAQRHADALFPTLPRVTVTVATPSDGMAIALDGVAIGHAEWGVAVPVDPGEHSIDAVAPHAKTWSKALTIANDAATTTVAVPSLEAAPSSAAPPPPPVAAAPAPAVAPPRAPVEDRAARRGARSAPWASSSARSAVVGARRGGGVRDQREVRGQRVARPTAARTRRTSARQPGVNAAEQRAQLGERGHRRGHRRGDRGRGGRGDLAHGAVRSVDARTQIGFCRSRPHGSVAAC